MNNDWHFLTKESIAFGRIAIIVALCFVSYKIINFFFGVISRHLSAKHWVFNGLLNAVQKPLRFFFLLFGITVVMQEIAKKLIIIDFVWITKFEILNAIFCLAWAIVRFVFTVKHHVLKSKEKDYEDKTLVLALSQIITVIVIIVTALFVLHVMHVNIAGFLALGGIGGIAIGFASKDLLSNFFGALMIYLDKPFQVGDWICSPDKEIEGIVESIGWRQVKIVTFESRPIYVPNSIFSTIVIENPTRMTHRRLKETVSIRYQDMYLAEDVVQDIKLMLALNGKVDKTKDIIVNIVNFDGSSINIIVLCYTEERSAVGFYLARQEILLECAKIIEKYGAEIALPVRNVTLRRSGIHAISSQP